MDTTTRLTDKILELLETYGFTCEHPHDSMNLRFDLETEINKELWGDDKSNY